MRGIERFFGPLRNVYVQAGLALLAIIVLSCVAGPWLMTRDVEIRMRTVNSGAAWKLDWSPAAGLPRNGRWIDLAAGRDLPPNAPIDTGDTPYVHRSRLANYAIDDVTLSWTGWIGATVTVEQAFVDTHVRKWRIHRKPLVLEHVDGALDNPEPKLPIVFFTAKADGGLRFKCPPPPAIFPLFTVGACAVFVLIAWGALALLWRLAGAYDRWISARPVPAQLAMKRLSIAAAIITVTVPFWMLCWAPMIISGDGTAYMWQAIQIMQSRSFENFDGWRLPGYVATIIPFMATMKDFAAGIGWAHAVMALLPPLLAFDMVRRRLASPWPQLAAIFVAVDPGLVLWQRTVMTEHQTAVLIMLCAWLFVVTADKLVRGARAWPVALALGLALSAACYTRPNIQVFAVLAPAALAVIGLRDLRARWFIAAGACLAVTVAALSPLIIHNARVFDRAAIVVGNDWNRVIWTWENGLLDWNQSGVIRFNDVREIERRINEGWFLSWNYTDIYQDVGIVPAPADAHPWTQRDIRSRVVWREAAARRPDGFVKTIARGVTALFGMPVGSPRYFHGDAPFVMGPLLGEESPFHPGTNWMMSIDAFAPWVADIFRPTMHEMKGATRSIHARILKGSYDAAAIVRPFIAILFVVVTVRLIRRGEWIFGALGAVFIAHMFALPLLVFTGNDRYALPWCGLMTVVTIVGTLARGPEVERVANPDAA